MADLANNTSEYRWHPIEDLPPDWQSMSNPELASLGQVWKDQHGLLKNSKSVKEFNERLLREWSIETGILERLYTIDQGVTQLLVEQGIDAALIPHGATDRPVAEVIHILQDHRDALEGIFEFVSKHQILTTSYIKQLHQVITRHQPYVEGTDQFGNTVRRELRRGDWKVLPNNPTRRDGVIHEYCPPLNVAAEIDELIKLHNKHEKEGVAPDVSAAWLHHRFTQIHPFEDGNGRMARALATLVFLQAGWFPLVVHRDQRGEYISALEVADAGDLKPLVTLFGQNAKRAFARALSLSEDVLHGEASLPEVVSGLFNLYQSRRKSVEEAYQRVESVAEQLTKEANTILEEVANELRKKFTPTVIERPPQVRVNHSWDYNDHYYSKEIVSVAQELDYWANVSRRRFWVRLHIFDQFTQQKTQIVFSFHYLGKTNRGVMACSAFVYFPEKKPPTHRELDDSGIIEPPHRELDDEEITEPQFGETHRICSEPFYLSYKDETQINSLREDFREWMREAVSVGLTEWVQRS